MAQSAQKGSLRLITHYQKKGCQRLTAPTPHTNIKKLLSFLINNLINLKS